ncbi:family 15 putative glycosyltransferase [Triangularia verruculosa]|uniref:Family 15 putative glycosyltransferase n=1 Tax=Triangularia verruculosa TaxID=2587418 RepID=A0AAN6X9B2_9PEZI|nr:family 15 putative glycosyltransferase [Triangularia verruculosa]
MKFLSAPFLLGPTSSISRRLFRSRRVRFLFKVSALILLLSVLEAFYHSQVSLSIPRPAEQHNLDEPFTIGCQDVSKLVTRPRENAVLVMLARNSELQEARATIRNVEDKFNKWFKYPVLFLNNEPWSEEFMRVMKETVSGEAKFEVIPEGIWGPTEGLTEEVMNKYLKQQEADGVYKGQIAGYHHMCRFYSGEFYSLEALKEYKYYWRLEPGVSYSCSLTYDPFLEMARRGKKYGYTVALWEEPNTCPSLFRAVDEFRTQNNIPMHPNWKAMIDTETNWLLKPAPIRWLLGKMLRREHYNIKGEKWNLCHYWSNFEIADLDFFRGDQYQRLFKHLDKSGGFYRERWGDAPVHSLAVHLLLEAKELHHFSDIGYYHHPFWQCPQNAKGRQLLDDVMIGEASQKMTEEQEGGFGCRCECGLGNSDDFRMRNNRGICLERMQQPAAWTRASWWDLRRRRWPYTVGFDNEGKKVV